MKEHTPARGAQLRDDLRRLALMVLASAVMAVNLKSFVQAGDLVPGGFNGLSLLIQALWGEAGLRPAAATWLGNFVASR